MFRANVDYDQIKNKMTEKMIVDLESVPEFIKSYTYSPKTVEYLIEK